MTAGGKLLIIERELPEIGTPVQSAELFLLDLEMLVMTPGGRERTRSEFARLRTDTQFKLARIVPTTSPVSIFEAHEVRERVVLSALSGCEYLSWVKGRFRRS